LLLFNPPYVPTPEEEVERGGIAAAWAGGWKGRRVIDRLIPIVPELLSERGEMLMVTVPDNDPKGKFGREKAFLTFLVNSFVPTSSSLHYVLINLNLYLCCSQNFLLQN
jgi:methylase of polypeptide subunit release factors